MQTSRAEILMEKLLSDSLSAEELEELLGLVETSEELISEVLRQYFERLVKDR